MMRNSVLRKAIDRLPNDVMRHMGNVGGRWLTECACKEIAEDPSVSTEDELDVFWLQVNHGNTLHIRFMYTHDAELLRVENVITQAILWERS